MNDQIADSAVRAEIRLVHPDARMPKRHRLTDAGYDIYSVDEVTLHPGDTKLINTGIELSVPHGWYYTMAGRSSLNDRKIFVVPPVIDATFTGPLFVIMRNDSSEPYQIGVGDRMAQILLHRVYDMEMCPVEEFSPAYSKRGNNGFGSSGR